MSKPFLRLSKNDIVAPSESTDPRRHVSVRSSPENNPGASCTMYVVDRDSTPYFVLSMRRSAPSFRTYGSRAPIWRAIDTSLTEYRVQSLSEKAKIISLEIMTMCTPYSVLRTIYDSITPMPQKSGSESPATLQTPAGYTVLDCAWVLGL